MTETVGLAMVERVAEAVREAMYDSGDPHNIARAAIAAMREPTHEMCVAGHLQRYHGYITAKMAKDAWQAMIDAAKH